MPKPHKLYCYVDETGQDTEGRLFVVVAVVVAHERDTLNQYLEDVEHASGIGKKKWVRAKTATTSRNQYLALVSRGDLKHKVFYSYYSDAGKGTFEYLTVLAIAKAVNTYREQHRIGAHYKVSITIDGLKGSEGRRIGRELRELGIQPRKIRGARDESEPIVRLADRIAGLVRDAASGGQSYQAVQRHLETQQIITRL